MLFKNFFRKDLNLKNRWWHRLLLVLFFVSFAVSLLYATFHTGQPDRYRQVSSLKDRMTNNLTKIGDLVKPGERIGENENRINDDLYYKNGGFLLSQNIYCAKNVTNHVDDFAKSNGASHFKGNDAIIMASSQVSSDEFKHYLTSESGNCIEIANLSDYENKNIIWSGIDKVVERSVFTNSMDVWTLDHTKTNLNRIFNPAYLGILILFGIIMILYYKVLLYIIFGNNKQYENK